MAKRKNNIYHFKILGADWTARCHAAKTFKLKYGNCGGITIPAYKEIHFRADEILLDTALHELWHGFLAQCNIDSANITAEQLEEITATLFSREWHSIIKCAIDMQTFFLLKEHE